MNFINRPMWPHCSVLIVGLAFSGCASDTSNPSQVAPTGTTSIPGATGGPPTTSGAPMHAQPGMAQPPGGNPQMAMTMQHGAPAAGNTNPNATPTNEQMAAMMKQNAPPAAQVGNAPGSPGYNAQMSAMMKQHGPSTGSNPNPTPSNEQMAAMMKQQQQNAPGAGGGQPKMPSADQMAAMMKQGGAGAPPGGAGAPPGGAGAPPGGAGMPPGGAGMAAAMGQAGGRPGMPGAGGQKSFSPGSADEALFNFCTAMAEGDVAAASEWISSKAKGTLADLRDGKLSDDKVEEITNILSPVNELSPNSDQNTNTKRSLRNGKKQVMSFSLKKEKDSYKITEFTFPKAKKSQ